MSKSMYHFCHKYNIWLTDYKKIEFSEEKVDCDLACKDCEYNDIVWVEEDD